MNVVPLPTMEYDRIPHASPEHLLERWLLRKLSIYILYCFCLMAVSKSFFGLRRKSTKYHTYQVDAFGQQVTKDRVSNVSNPRTPAQMAQRMLMATVSAAYAGVKQIADHSWEGVKYGAPTMSKFVQANLNRIREFGGVNAADFGFNEYQNRALLPGAYQMSNGSLEPVVFILGVAPSSAQSNAVGFRGGSSSKNIEFAGIREGLSYGAMLANYGMAVGDTLTFVGIGLVNEKNQLIFVRLTAQNKSTAETPTISNYSEFFKIESNVQITSEISGALQVALTNVGGTDRSVGDNVFVEGAWGVILSKKTASGWKRSTCYLNTDYYQYNVSPTGADAILTYPVGDAVILNGGSL